MKQNWNDTATCIMYVRYRESFFYILISTTDENWMYMICIFSVIIDNKCTRIVDDEMTIERRENRKRERKWKKESEEKRGRGKRGGRLLAFQQDERRFLPAETSSAS